VTYTTGYNMVGGPTGTDLSAADEAFSFANSAYTLLTGPATACQGYFAYFTHPTTIGLPSATGPTRVCHLGAGWTLLGNPFSGAALLPSGTTGAYWNPTTKSYSQVTAIPQGGAVYVYTTVAQDITLTYQPVPGNSAPIINITDTTQGPITLHVGDIVHVQFQRPNAEVLSYDTLYFKGISGGTTFPTTCYNPSFCVVTDSSLSWTGQVLTAGQTFFTFSPICFYNSPGSCLFKPQAISVNILP
jgi:hypothetical protein